MLSHHANGVPFVRLNSPNHRKSPTTRAMKTTTSTHAPAANNLVGINCPHSSIRPRNTSAAAKSNIETNTVAIDPGTKVGSPEARLGIATSLPHLPPPAQ